MSFDYDFSYGGEEHYTVTHTSYETKYNQLVREIRLLYYNGERPSDDIEYLMSKIDRREL